MSVLLDVVQAHDPGGREMVRRVPEEGTAGILMGSACIVQESQVAAFYRDGHILDVLGPGRHVLSTGNLPVLSTLLSLPFGAKSPFQAAVYFVNQKVFTGMKWGTRNPVAFRDRELGMVRLRAYGMYSMRVADPALFLNTVVGARGVFTAEDVEEYNKDVVVSRLNGLLGERLARVLDLPALYNELATETRLELKDDFVRLGIDLIDFFITSVVPTEEGNQAIDEQAGTNGGGPADAYLQYQAGKALRPQPGTAGNGAAQGLGIGVGGGMGLILPQAVLGKDGVRRDCPRCAPAANGTPTANRAACIACTKELPPQARFCPHCGSAQR